mmetsp:Transcript_8188/g.22705  ORF Transcript_8188/g.22705 Transcript_8188/m.22705 type:complete len:104 (-) Transcript_8188:209-520(-)
MSVKAWSIWLLYELVIAMRSSVPLMRGWHLLIHNNPRNRLPEIRSSELDFTAVAWCDQVVIEQNCRTPKDEFVEELSMSFFINSSGLFQVIKCPASSKVSEQE